ncbi:NADP-dependent succinic semialdehyde dehydrogenase [Mycolicibacterium chubuense]|uniref:Succinate-semialdehyde dehydrogenase [NADP(+)] 1 n=1 Tax=Mycolicibacterium chubuense TaxID=1800 RepID=A0A0J6YH43_MYCCU|nr:NADP-dependent succinic semialdehyde dehydrogenase [Mycolicibacterium chubuense]KMO72216.1 Succinate-semialdehyde dehydrogenase [NADP(+)] 1 [Mycolicibacterium chubuense]ORA53014.1 NADP-dependent succinic semialdehyde dehydrogenase [Mycolicibacterium chubuense]SPX97985.1 succinate-semialdehyde dehydrogenase [NADP+] 1 [Mycolicibacterium chubuense]
MAIETVNPATGEIVESFEPHDSAEVERRIAQAFAAAQTLRDTNYAQRAQWMHATADILEGEVDRAAAMITLEMGKPIAQSRAEVLKCAKNIRFYADNAESFLAPEELADPSAVSASAAGTVWQPLGVVLAVMPWNYPLWQVIRFAAPALMAGNTGLLKHASNVPQSALYLDELFEKGGFPAGSFRTLLIGSREVAAVIEDSRVKAVTLTGSEPAGRSVASTAGQEIKKAVLELGGSDPFIVMPSADLDAASSVAVKARISNNGQSCIAGKRFIVHADVYDAFVDLFVDKMKALSVGDPMDEAIDVGPLATESGRADVAELVEDAVAKGAQVLAGGSAPDRPGWFYSPTVLAGLTDDMRVVMEETFGPVASVYRVADREEAVRVANQTTFGLSSAVWSGDETEQDWFVAHLDAGAVFLNGMTVSYPELPFGGIKDSGYGRELAAAGIREFCNLKTVWKA